MKVIDDSDIIVSSSDKTVKALYTKASSEDPLKLTYEKKLDKVNALGEDIAAADSSKKKDNILLSAYQEEAELFKNTVIADTNNNINTINTVSEKVAETVDNIKSSLSVDTETLKTVGLVAAVLLGISAISNLFRR